MAMRSVAGNKPIAIGECQFIPSSSLLSPQPHLPGRRGAACQMQGAPRVPIAPNIVI
jgi:hypothetical protein